MTNTENLKYFVTLGGITGTVPTVIDVVEAVKNVSVQTGTTILQVDNYGNNITETTKLTEISSDTYAQLSIKQIVKQNVAVATL